MATSQPPAVDAPGAQPHVGERVVVRRHQWTVGDVSRFEDCTLLTLQGREAANAVRTRRVLTPFDAVEREPGGRRIERVGFRRWLRRFRAVTALDGVAASLRTAANADIDLLPHQLEPALAVVAGAGSRVLIADEVGLGKTIQAALLVAELQARGAGERVLVLTPAGLRDQWASELLNRFHIPATVADAGELRRRAAALAPGVNPWCTMPVAIASTDYVKRPEILPLVLACRWDVVIVDEAHGAAPETDRHAAVAAICSRAPCLVLLTATPHSGDRRAFEALCNTGSLEGDRLLLFRRTRADVALEQPRHVHCLRVHASTAELRLHALLAAFAEALQGQSVDRRDATLALTVLYKRAWSCARALEETVRRRLSLVPTAECDHDRQLLLPLDDCGEHDHSDEPPQWNTPLLANAADERRWLESIAAAAATAAQSDSKLGRLVRLVARLVRAGEAVIVFTEYRDTLLHILAVLGRAASVLHGGLSRDERRANIEAFTSGSRRLLLATDAGGEGLNLHHGCRIVINLELPWNPLRLEQRIGRVDRIGQKRTVHAFHLIATACGETRVEQHLQRRIAQARFDIAASDPLGLMGPPDAGLASTVDDVTEPLRSSGARRAAAAIEFERLQQARHVTAGRCAGPMESGDALDAKTSVAATKRSRVRRAFGRGALALIESRLEDRFGRLAAVHLTPLLVRLARDSIPTVRTLCAALERMSMASVDQAVTGWAAASIQAHQAFWNTRLAREEAIARAAAGVQTAAVQPGLFDRRAERERLVLDAERNAFANEALGRIAIARQAADCVVLSPTIALILFF